MIFLTYVYKLGFYKSIIKFFDSRDSIFVSVSGSLLFGFSWAVFYIFQFSDSATSYSTIIILQGLLLASVLYAFINISRDVAKYLLYPYFTNDDAKPVIIYGAGRAGNELYQSLLLDPSKRVLAFFDDSKNLKNQLINNIPILGSFKKIIQLKESFSNLDIFCDVSKSNNMMSSVSLSLFSVNLAINLFSFSLGLVLVIALNCVTRLLSLLVPCEQEVIDNIEVTRE